jgi:hypothetical protein
MSTVQYIGRQQVRISGNLVEATFAGTLTEDELKELLSCYDRVIAEHGHLCALSDMQQSSAIDPKGRRLAVKWAHPSHPDPA